jgi:2-polyprenyl-3-methyl-5-hydroxy-6-metoxy-1,4-benzoquinol methylase
MEFTIQHYACPLCKKDESKLLLKKQGFHIVTCGNCGFVYVNPRLANEQLNAIYQHNYFQNKDYGYVDYEQEKRLRVKNFERWLSTAEHFLPPGKTVVALDVGCAAGYCLDVMKAKGWQAEGLELDAAMCDSLTKAGHIVSHRELENFESPHRFSLISLFDVIEHIPDINAAFQQLNRLLEKDGVIIMITPDHNSLQRKLFGKKWFQYKPIEHIQYFTRKTLAVFAERNGLQILYHDHSGQYADTQFIVNRLSYYHFPFLYGLFEKIFAVLRLKNKFFYPGTGSLFVVLKKK